MEKRKNKKDKKVERLSRREVQIHYPCFYKSHSHNMSRQEEIQTIKKEYLQLADKFTPEEIKGSPILQLQETGEITISLTAEVIEKLQLENRLQNYEKEAMVSTGGIRWPQNILYPWDTRFPINQMGVILATLGKWLVLKEDVPIAIHKIAAGEVRYNTQDYIDIIARVQAGMGIYTHIPFDRQTIPIRMVSFLIFMLDYDGGEFVTSSHAISSKIATKDLENQGSQFLPEMSSRFINKVKGIFQYAKEHPEWYTITLSPQKSPFIKEDFNGYDMYIQYLEKSVAKPANIELIKKAQAEGLKIMFDTVGWCMYKTMSVILEKIGIENIFERRNKEEDPFFHGIGKVWKENTKTQTKEVFDYSCDFCLQDVVKTADFESDLKDKPIGYIVLITDPDWDRLSMGQIESIETANRLDELGIDYITLDEKRLFVVYYPTFSFFLIMDFYMKQLRTEGLLDHHPRFIIVTTPSSKCRDEWAEHNQIKVITTPVGMKELITMLKKIEKQILEKPNQDVIVENVFGEKINLGKDPRMIFGGEESGGMITGVEDFIESKKGRRAMAMREKSAGEACIIATALSSFLFFHGTSILEYLEEIFEENNIKSIIYGRDDITYYNESEPDPIKLQQAKREGEVQRDKTDTFYISLALAFRSNAISIDQVRSILQESIPELDFSRLESIKFTGDATYFQFIENMFIQVRRSWTDAKMRGYSGGPDNRLCKDYLDKLLHYPGERSDTYQTLIPQKYQEDTYTIAKEIYTEYVYKWL